MRITITKSDIKNGIKSCADVSISLAMKRKKIRASILSHGMNYYWKGGFFQVGLPIKVEEFITRFDAGRKVNPFSFNLNVK